MRISDCSSDVVSSDLLISSSATRCSSSGGVSTNEGDFGRMARPQAGRAEKRRHTPDRRPSAGNTHLDARQPPWQLRGAARRRSARKSDVSGKSLSVRLALGGHHIIIKKHTIYK